MAKQITVVLNDQKLVECFENSTAAREFIKKLCEVVDLKQSISTGDISEQNIVLEWAKQNFKPAPTLDDRQFKEYCDAYYKKKRKVEKDILYDMLREKLDPEQEKLLNKYYETILDTDLDLKTELRDILG